jgi:hypothetical protein
MERPFATRGREKGRSARPRAARATAQLFARPGAPFNSAGGRKHEVVETLGLIPLAEGELAVIETYLGQALDELLGGGLNS